ncbi:hypothetical protein ACOZ4B_01600 (plasmid) [Haloferax prahovense]|uniref:hypothetical protein n=1 Tax=Haloferax prahovense TaxID=381852 RepID=UPI003C78F7C2
MTGSDPEDCCRGAYAASQKDEFTQATVWDACRSGIRDAIESQLSDSQSSAVIIDGLPTVGKTRHATDIAFKLDAPVAILTHRYETRDEHLHLASEHQKTVAEIPTLDRDCPTRQGEHGSEWAERINDYRSRGASPTYLHYYLQDALPCMRDGDCPYIERWDAVESADVVVGGPAHAALDRVVDDRVVIFDEDPGTAYRTEFDANQLTSAISSFLRESDSLPIDNYLGLLAVATNESMADIQDTIRDELTDTESISQPTAAVNNEDGHAEAPTAILAHLEFGGSIVDDMGPDYYDWDDSLREQAELDYVELEDGAQVVYDRTESRVFIRRPPNLDGARAVVGLDGTPVEELWCGRLGIDDIESWRILCDDCRARYLCDVIGYTFVQTTSHVKPYSSGEYVNRRADFGVIEAVANQHETKPGIITTKSAAERLFEEPPNEPFIHTERVTRRVADVKHYGALRSSNDFVGMDVGIVIGSPHPGDRPIQITAALEGYTAVRDEEGKGTDLDYGIPERPFLRHYREHKIAQAVLRFGRTTAATVYIHTGVLPEWLAEMVTAGPDAVEIAERSEGQRAVIRALLDGGPGTASEISNREGVSIGEKQTRDWLKRLRSEGYVCRDESQPYTWSPNGLDDAPHTADVRLPELN